MARITRVAIRDYRSIGWCDVELQPLTLLVGPNGSGKSNFLEALRFLSQAMLAPLEQVLTDRLALTYLLRKMPEGHLAPSFSITVDFVLNGDSRGTYSLMIGRSEDGAAMIEREQCAVGEASFLSTPYSLDSTVSAVPALTGDRPALAAFSALPVFAPVFNLLVNIHFYAPDTLRMRSPRAKAQGRLLLADASNAADVLWRLNQDTPEVLARIVEYLHALSPELSHMTAVERADYRWLMFKPASLTNWWFTGADLSDGTLRAVGLLLAIFQYQSSSLPVTLVGLEEPESQLHPAAAGILLDALLEASSRVPIIVSTHSADLLDRKEIPESALLAVAMQDGETMIGPVNERSKSILRKRLYTAGELLRTNELRPEVSTTPR